MSNTANWSYTYPATVYPFEGMDGITGADSYGTPYQIMCNVTAVTATEKLLGGQSGAQGIVANATHVIYTEDARPQKDDLIEFVESGGKRKIIDRTFWEMTAFGETPDYKLVT